MAAFVSDIRYMWASMRRDRRFALTALLTIALGVGATSAVFSVVYGVLLRPLPYTDPDRLVALSEEHPGGTAVPGDPALSNTTYYAWRARMRTLDSIAAYGRREYSVRLDGETTRLHGGELSASAFPLLGARPEAGRVFVIDARRRTGGWRRSTSRERSRSIAEPTSTSSSWARSRSRAAS